MTAAAIVRRGKQVHNAWTTHEIGILRSTWPVSKEECYVLLPRHTRASVAQQARVQGFRERQTRSGWTVAQKTLLRSAWENNASKETLCSLLLVHSWRTIRRQAKAMGLRKRLFGKHQTVSSVSVIRELLALRLEKEISVTALADKMGYGAEHIAGMESGRFMPRMRTLLDWCDALGVTLTIK